MRIRLSNNVSMSAISVVFAAAMFAAAPAQGSPLNIGISASAVQGNAPNAVSSPFQTRNPLLLDVNCIGTVCIDTSSINKRIQEAMQKAQQQVKEAQKKAEQARAEAQKKIEEARRRAEQLLGKAQQATSSSRQVINSIGSSQSSGSSSVSNTISNAVKAVQTKPTWQVMGYKNASSYNSAMKHQKNVQQTKKKIGATGLAFQKRNGGKTVSQLALNLRGNTQSLTKSLEAVNEKIQSIASGVIDESLLSSSIAAQNYKNRLTEISSELTIFARESELGWHSGDIGRYATALSGVENLKGTVLKITQEAKQVVQNLDSQIKTALVEIDNKIAAKKIFISNQTNLVDGLVRDAHQGQDQINKLLGRFQKRLNLDFPDIRIQVAGLINKIQSDASNSKQEIDGEWLRLTQARDLAGIDTLIENSKANTSIAQANLISLNKITKSLRSEYKSQSKFLNESGFNTLVDIKKIAASTRKDIRVSSRNLQRQLKEYNKILGSTDQFSAGLASNIAGILSKTENIFSSIKSNLDIARSNVTKQESTDWIDKEIDNFQGKKTSLDNNLKTVQAAEKEIVAKLDLAKKLKDNPLFAAFGKCGSGKAELAGQCVAVDANNRNMTWVNPKWRTWLNDIVKHKFPLPIGGYQEWLKFNPLKRTDASPDLIEKKPSVFNQQKPILKAEANDPWSQYALKGPKNEGAPKLTHTNFLGLSKPKLNDKGDRQEWNAEPQLLHKVNGVVAAEILLGIIEGAILLGTTFNSQDLSTIDRLYNEASQDCIGRNFKVGMVCYVRNSPTSKKFCQNTNGVFGIKVAHVISKTEGKVRAMMKPDQDCIRPDSVPIAVDSTPTQAPHVVVGMGDKREFSFKITQGTITKVYRQQTVRVNTGKLSGATMDDCQKLANDNKPTPDSEIGQITLETRGRAMDRCRIDYAVPVRA